jgi:hypothetical protein
MLPAGHLTPECNLKGKKDSILEKNNCWLEAVTSV